MTAADDGDEEAGDAWECAQAELFAHVGVTDPEDWRSVALRLASRYAPELLTDAGPFEPMTPARKVGRPEKWSDGRLWLLAAFVDLVRERSRDGRLRPGLDTYRDACKFIAGKAPETQWMRDALGLDPGISPDTLDNRRREALRCERSAAANGNG